MYDGDELILSGDGGGCWDDEDCISMTDGHGHRTGGHGFDELITPVVMVAPPTARPGLRPSSSGGQSSSSGRGGHSGYGLPGWMGSGCDDDDQDCDDGLEGSGGEEPNTFFFNHVTGGGGVDGPGNAYDGGPSGPYPVQVTFRPLSHSTPPTYIYVPVVARTSTTQVYDNSILYTFKPIPPPDDPPPIQSYRPRPTRPTGRPVIVDVPKPQIPSSRDPNSNHFGGAKNQITSVSTNKAAADQTALIIGLVAVLIIIIVIVAPLILFLVKIRYRNGSQFVNFAPQSQPLMVSKSVRFADPATPTPPPVASITGSYHQSITSCPPIGIDTGSLMSANSTPVHGKDHKEWYV